MTIEISKEKKKRLIESIMRYFAENMDEDIGDLKATLLLDFCLREIGPTVYNGAIFDVQAYMQDRLADAEASMYEPEFSYWEK
jgi:uncharacterized protein (DUF2164 family)